MSIRCITHVNTVMGLEKEKNETANVEGKLQSGKILLLITGLSEPLLPCCETDVWVKIFHKLKLLTAIISEHTAYCGRGCLCWVCLVFSH